MIEKKNALALISAFAIGLLCMYMVMSSLSVSMISVSTSITHIGEVHVEAWHPDGQVFYNVWTHNTFTNLGTNITTNRGLLLNFTFYNSTTSWYNNTLTCIEVGNDSGTVMGVTSTALTTEDTSVCTRHNGTLSWPYNWQTNSSCFQTTYTWSSVSSAVTLNATGECLTTTASTSDLCAFATFTTATLASGDSLAVTWTDTCPSG